MNFFNISVAVVSLFFTLNVSAKTCTYAIKEGTQKLTWTGFKYTEKTAVSGTFKETIFAQNEKSNSMTELLESIEFTVDAASVDSGNEARDATLRKSIFGFLKMPNQITGRIVSATQLDMKLEITMNERMPLDMVLKASNGKLTATGSIDLFSHGLQKSYDAVHLACKGLHTGKDGVSKTWSTVDLKLEADYEEKCSKGFMDSIKSWFS